MASTSYRAGCPCLLVVVLVFSVLGGADLGRLHEIFTSRGRAAGLPRQHPPEGRRRSAASAGAARWRRSRTRSTTSSTEIEKRRTARNSGSAGCGRSDQVASLWGFPPWLGPMSGPRDRRPRVVLVIFMLLEREDLRDRLIGLIGHGHLAVDDQGASTKRASASAASCCMQTLVNLIYGSIAAAGLWIVRRAVCALWGALGAVLRFIPYLGPVSPRARRSCREPGGAARMEAIRSWCAASSSPSSCSRTWCSKPILYAGAMGVSQVALMVSVAFWTWLWGPLGLLHGDAADGLPGGAGQARSRAGVPRHADVRRAGADAREQPTTSGCWRATRRKPSTSSSAIVKSESGRTRCSTRC